MVSQATLEGLVTCLSAMKAVMNPVWDRLATLLISRRLEDLGITVKDIRATSDFSTIVHKTSNEEWVTWKQVASEPAMALHKNRKLLGNGL